MTYGFRPLIYPARAVTYGSTDVIYPARVVTYGSRGVIYASCVVPKCTIDLMKAARDCF